MRTTLPPTTTATTTASLATAGAREDYTTAATAAAFSMVAAEAQRSAGSDNDNGGGGGSGASAGNNWDHARWGHIAIATLFYAIVTTTWLTSFSSLVPLVPYEWRPEVDVVTLPRIETWLFGRYLGSTMRKHLLLDMLAAVPYMLHFTIPFCFLVAAFIANRRAPCSSARPISFGGALATTSMLMHGSQFFWPFAPPWYTQASGHSSASYLMHGNPGGLGRIDDAFNITMFHRMYHGAPIVFGSFPSMHCGWPMLVFMFQWTTRGRIFSALHIMLICWAALYLTHHFLVDILAAYFYNIVGIWLSRMLWLVFGRLWGGYGGLIGYYIDIPPTNPTMRHAAEKGARMRFWRASVAVLFGYGMRPWAAPDVCVQSMDDVTRCYWAPDVCDVAPHYGHVLRYRAVK